MYNTIPSVKIEDVVISSETRYGYNDIVCAIGCFNNTTNGINLCKSADEAKELYADDDDYSSKYFDTLFSKNNKVLIYNTNYGKESASESITVQDISKAQEELKFDKFDILLPLVNIPLKVDSNINPLLTSLEVMHSAYFEDYDKPFGIICGIDITGASVQDLNNFKTLFEDHGIYKAICTPLSIDGDDYDVCMSAVYNTVVTINKPVNESETMMIYDNNVDGKVTQEILPSGLTIQNLIDNGFHTVQYFNRGDKTLQCISNVTPNEYDMRIERSFNYIISRIEFMKVLGMDNNRISYDVLDGIIKYEKTTAIKSGLCTDMVYDIAKTGSDEVTVELTIVFNDIIRTVKANVNVVIE